MRIRQAMATIGVGLLLLSGCSKRQEPAGAPGGESSARFETGAPDVAPSAAPGVAFRYNYDFQLSDEAISAVQEAHASACEHLGIERCRITGLNFSVDNDNNVWGSLEVKLAPDIARSFGKDATAAVMKAGGRLSHTEFTGEDTAPATEQATREGSEARERIADLERRLAAKGPKDAERAQLQAQLDELRNQASAANTTLAGERAKLASTPMSFRYAGKGGISGFAGRNPLSEALRSLVASAVTMISVVLQFVALVLPWLLLALFLIFLARSAPGRRARRWLRPAKPVEEAYDPAD